ncbi:MAG TPA: DUF2934 domain-containing protein [Burkholderiales bacterium]|nr:DUF2934 domain-containing protein [Burkholderiales bacterium]
MAGSTLDPDNVGPGRRRRKTLKGHDERALGPSDSSDTGSDVVPAPPVGGMDEGEPDAADIGVDRVVGAGEAGLGGGLDQAEEALLRDEIAKEAYYRAEKRGFAPGHEDEDWRQAEAEVRARRTQAKKSPRKRR